VCRPWPVAVRFRKSEPDPDRMSNALRVPSQAIKGGDHHGVRLLNGLDRQWHQATISISSLWAQPLKITSCPGELGFGS
jgi:hypothetical protein